MANTLAIAHKINTATSVQSVAPELPWQVLFERCPHQAPGVVRGVELLFDHSGGGDVEKVVSV